MWNSKTEYRVLICGGNDYGKRWDTRLNEVVADTRAIHKLHSILQDIRDTKVPDDCTLVLLHRDGVGTDKITEEWAAINSIKTIELSSDSSIEDAKKSDQVVRGSVVLPAGTGKSVRVAVFAQGEKAEQAKAAGAEIVGMDDLADQTKAGKIDFDILIASPDAMRIVGTLGQILGPRGLMPNPKVGTVSPDVAGAVKNAKAGQVQFRVDKAGIIHATIGRRSFEPSALKSNLMALLDALNKAKPASSKGIYLRKVAVSSTMGAGVRVDQASLAA